MKANALPAARTCVQSISPCQWLMSIPSVGAAAFAALGATKAEPMTATSASRIDARVTDGDRRGWRGMGITG